MSYLHDKAKRRMIAQRDGTRRMQKLSGGDKDWSRNACGGRGGVADACTTRANCKPHVLEAESLYGIQCVGYQFAGQSGEERGNHRQRGRAEPSSEPGEHHETFIATSLIVTPT